MKSRIRIDDGRQQPSVVTTEVRSTPVSNPITPTGNVRHIPKIRLGRISAEVFSKARLATIPPDIDYSQPASYTEIKAAVEGGRKVADNAAKRRRSQGPPRDAQAVREEEGDANLLAAGDEKRQRQIKRRKSKKRVQAPSQKAQAKKLKGGDR